MGVRRTPRKSACSAHASWVGGWAWGGQVGLAGHLSLVWRGAAALPADRVGEVEWVSWRLFVCSFMILNVAFRRATSLPRMQESNTRGNMEANPNLTDSHPRLLLELCYHHLLEFVRG